MFFQIAYNRPRLFANAELVLHLPTTLLTEIILLKLTLKVESCLSQTDPQFWIY